MKESFIDGRESVKHGANLIFIFTFNGMQFYTDLYLIFKLLYIFFYSDAPHCRICHEGDEEEDLLSPCFCSGSVGALHMSCLEKWLGASDKTRCEICGFQFSISKNPKPVTWVRVVFPHMCNCIYSYIISNTLYVKSHSLYVILNLADAWILQNWRKKQLLGTVFLISPFILF